MIEILPGIQEESFAKICQKIRLVEPYVNWVQIDVTDKTLTENESFRDPKPFKNLKTRVNFEVHLMFDDPLKVVPDWAEAGFKRLIGHVESQDPGGFVRWVRERGLEVGLALDGPTPVGEIVPYLPQVDQVLVMMYKAGPSGQKFQKENLKKIKFIHQNFPNLPIEVDGGINGETAKMVKEAGASRLVSTSFLFWQNRDHLEEAIEILKYGESKN